MTTLRPRTGSFAAALIAAAFAAAPAAAQVSDTLTFDAVLTNADGFNSTPFTGQRGYAFENWGVLSTAQSLGAGNNAASGTQFAYGFATFDSFIYRPDATRFGFGSAFLSFRTYDGDVTPAEITVRGYRGDDEVFTRVLTLTNSAQRFTFNWRQLDEIAFETGALSGTRSAVLAADDVALATVPEPATVVLLGAGGAVILLAGRMRRRSS